MPKCVFDKKFSGSPEDLVILLKEKVEDANGTFFGNTSQGEFQVPVLGTSLKGTYTISGSTIHVEIDKKPIVISCNQIGDFLDNNLP